MEGRRSEAEAGRALQALEEMGYIRDHFVSTPNGPRDKMGIDAGMTTVDGVEVLFQIKSSDRGVRKHYQKHPTIPCLNVQGCVDALDIMRLIKDRFGLSRVPRV